MGINPSGGVFYCNNCTLFVISSLFVGNNAAKDGGVIFVSGTSTEGIHFYNYFGLWAIIILQ